MIKFKSLIFTLLLLTTFATTAYTDSQSGMDAYSKGDYKTALSEWKLLAKEGDVKAQYSLSYMYANGKGVLKDMTEAKFWAKKAYENTDTSIREDTKKLWEEYELWKY